jgi:enoyl-CoA hydratase
VAAVNGHAFAGGLITAAVCDQRIAVDDELLDRAVAIAEQTPEDCLEQYAFTKRACQAAALRDIAHLADSLDQRLPDEMTGEGARHAHRRYWEQLNGRPAPW